jgi:N6-L-threonylcarbamoyladenine synthase
LEDIDVFAATRGPGLAIALEVGLRKIKEFATTYKKPMVAVNHMEGHIYSTLAKNSHGLPRVEYQFPLLVLLISGGHTELVLMKEHGEYEIIGQTLDDAIGEAYDKVGRMLDLGYPAGPAMERLAEDGDEDAYVLPIPMKHSKDGAMSYSGLKTAAMKLINEKLAQSNKYLEKFRDNLSSTDKRRIEKEKSTKSEVLITKSEREIVSDISASFQKAAVEQVLLKTEFVLRKLQNEGYSIQDLIIGGGVAQNKYLRKAFRTKFSKELRIHYPQDKKLYTDNAGMIGVAAYWNAVRGNFVEDIENIDREPNWSLDEL